MSEVADLVFERIVTRLEEDNDGCLLWIGGCVGNGYGYLSSLKSTVHRAVYEVFVGPIPNGLTLDHLCRKRICCNPDCLEPVSGIENTLRGNAPSSINKRKTHCNKNHPYDESNTYRWNNRRYCIICRDERNRARYV